MRISDDKTVYDYIWNHVDDFKVVAKDPSIWIDRIASVFVIKQYDPRNYYLGNNYTYHSRQDVWTYGCQTYVKEGVTRVERIYGYLPKELPCHWQIFI